MHYRSYIQTSKAQQLSQASYTKDDKQSDPTMDISLRPPSSSRSLQLPPTAEEEEDDFFSKEEAPEDNLSTSPTSSSSTGKPSSSRLLIPPSDASVVSGVSNIQPHSARDLQHLTSNMGAGVTYAGQDSLPRLPIPDLNETMEKFQYRLEALQDETQREEAKRVVREFLEGDGPKLQEALREYESEGIADERIGVSFVNFMQTPDSFGLVISIPI